MPNNIDQAITDLTATADKTVGVEESAIVVINGIQAMIDAAVAAAVAQGATPAQMQGFNDLSARLSTTDDQLAAAVANVPTPPTPPLTGRK